ncbi:MAG: hypothetical protein ACE5GT_05930 [Rhodospirillales bacterium]
MDFIEETIIKFGFTQDSTIVAIVCLVSLLGNFAGGLVTSILIAHSGAIRELPLTKRTSFRLAVFGEALVIIYAGFYHVFLLASISVAQAVLWGFTLLASPALAALGAQVTYVAFAKKIEEGKKQYRDRQRDERKAQSAEQNGAE